jgi:hypothetical protein
MGLIVIAGMVFTLVTYLVAIVGAGILWNRCKTAHTAMLFFGFIVATIPALFAFAAMQLQFSSVNFMAVNMMAAMGFIAICSYIGTIIAAIGLLLYALSLPKN